MREGLGFLESGKPVRSMVAQAEEAVRKGVLSNRGFDWRAALRTYTLGHRARRDDWRTVLPPPCLKEV